MIYSETERNREAQKEKERGGNAKRGSKAGRVQKKYWKRQRKEADQVKGVTKMQQKEG